jgi:N4-gp56 family major capsid protein
MAEQIYNDPSNGALSSVGPQLRTDYYQKKALIEAARESYFGQLADTTAMPKNMGKTIKRFHYLPILDDANINDQGIDAAGVAITDGNLYGSSKDVGYISGKLPALSETGGRVNRVGMTRFQIEGSITKYGFFEEYTKESIDFDTDAELEMHINSEMVKGANEMTEDMIQMDLLAGAGVIRYGGIATVDSEVSGEAGEVSVIDYNDLMRLEIDLDNNRCPKNTKVITGSRMIDTKVIDGARYIYVGSEMIPSLKKMTDNFANQAFISVANYASAGNVARGEIGSIGGFRVIVVPEMLHWAGAGKAVTTNTGYRETNNAYDIYPMLVVGSGSFTTIGFQTDGKTTKFKIKHVKPESEVSYSSADPFGEMGFMSIKWYYGSMILRPERIALVKTVAEY